MTRSPLPKCPVTTRLPISRAPHLLPGLLACLLLVTAACGALPAAGDPGVVALQPFSREEIALRGLIPNGCAEQVPGNFGCPSAGSGDPRGYLVIQQSVTYTLEELRPILLAQVGLTAMPGPIDSYRGAALDWTVYEFEGHVSEVGPQPVRFDLAVAAGDSRTYLVALVTLPEDYAANRVRYETIFYHMLYALTPLE